jgi:hypothetical protein
LLVIGIWQATISVLPRFAWAASRTSKFVMIACRTTRFSWRHDELRTRVHAVQNPVRLDVLNISIFNKKVCRGKTAQW